MSSQLYCRCSRASRKYFTQFFHGKELSFWFSWESRGPKQTLSFSVKYRYCMRSSFSIYFYKKFMYNISVLLSQIINNFQGKRKKCFEDLPILWNPVDFTNILHVSCFINSGLKRNVFVHNKRLNFQILSLSFYETGSVSIRKCHEAESRTEQ
jgi:hypothetical protein